MKIAHVSDTHFGRIAHPGIVRALVDEINASEVDLVALSGDLTQRATHAQYAAAAAMIEAFASPVLVVPGNHDVHAWRRPLRRLREPLGRYRRYITEDLMPTFEADGLCVLGINSAHGRTVKGGRIELEAQRAVETFFAGRSEATFKVLVVHHHLTKIQALGPHDVIPKARQTLRKAIKAGVDLILCGHLHISHVEPIEIEAARHRLVIASAGTATSSRGRRSNRRTNFYNLVTVGPETFSVEERRYEREAERFVRDDETTFERSGLHKKAPPGPRHPRRPLKSGT